MSNIVIMFCIILFLLLILNLSMWSICRQNYLNAKKLRNIQERIILHNTHVFDALINDGKYCIYAQENEKGGKLYEL